jgi:hemoglobin
LLIGDPLDGSVEGCTGQVPGTHRSPAWRSTAAHGSIGAVREPADLTGDVGPARGFHDEVGGAPVFGAIADRFYAQAAVDPVLRPLYPDDDLGPARERLRTYLAQYWGGPRDYSALRGSPLLRLRHVGFAIGRAERAAWVRCMRVAVEESGMDEAHRERMLGQLLAAATGLVFRA